MLDFFDQTFIMDRIIPKLNRGLYMTLRLIIPAILAGTALGIFTGVVRVFGATWMRRLANSCVAVIRGVPLTIQLMIIYFGLPYIEIRFEPYSAALLGFILCTGAYQSEYVRGALLSIRQGQITAGHALGLSRFQTIISIIIPQAIRRALPGCGNEIIYLIKYSSLAYVVACIELTGEAKVLVARAFRPAEIYTVAACYYLLMVTLATWGLNWLEKKLSIPGFGKNTS